MLSNTKFMLFLVLAAVQLIKSHSKCNHSPLLNIGPQVYVLLQNDTNTSFQETLACSLGTRMRVFNIGEEINCTYHGIDYYKECGQSVNHDQLCHQQKKRFLFLAYDWELMIIAKWNKPATYCDVTPPGTGLLSINIWENSTSPSSEVSAYYSSAFGSWNWSIRIDNAQLDKVVRSIVSISESAIQNEENLKKLKLDARITWATPQYPAGPFQFGIRRGPGASKGMRDEYSEFQELLLELAKAAGVDVYAISSVQCIILVFIVIFCLVVAFGSIDLRDVAPDTESNEQEVIPFEPPEFDVVPIPLPPPLEVTDTEDLLDSPPETPTSEGTMTTETPVQPSTKKTSKEQPSTKKQLSMKANIMNNRETIKKTTKTNDPVIPAQKTPRIEVIPQLELVPTSQSTATATEVEEIQGTPSKSSYGIQNTQLSKKTENA